MTRQVAGIVLAAGEGRRFGGIKQLATFRGEPLVRRALRAAHDAGAAPIHVVLGAHGAEVQAALDGADVRIVMNPAWSSGIASSVRAGISAVKDDVAGVLISSIDQPLVDAAMLRSLIDAFAAGHDIVAAAYDEIVGIPIVVAQTALADLAASLAGDRGAGAWLRARRERVTTIPLPAAAHDADTPEALRAIDGVDVTRGGNGP